MDHDGRLKLFDAVMAEHGSFLEAILWRLTGDRELFAEAMQESLLQMWRHVEKLAGPATHSYLYRIAQSGASNAWRKRGRSNGQDVPDRECALGSPTAQAGTNEMAAIVRQAISHLPEQQGRAIALRYLEQKDYEVMAREMGCSEASVRTHVCRGLAVLRSVMVRHKAGEKS